MEKKSSERTSYEVRRRWDQEHHKIYSIRLRLNEDAELIEFIESNKGSVGTSQLFREAIAKLKNEGLK